MNITNFLRPGILTLAACGAVVLAVPHAAGFQQPVADKQALLKQARSAYYSLKTEGMQGFRCDMTPNWAALLAEQRKTNPEAIDKAVERLKAIHFTVEVDGEGGAKVQHNEIAADNQQMAEGLRQVYSGMEQMTTGFFQTWAIFVVHPALPEEGTDFDLETTPQRHHLSYKEGATALEVTMSRQFSISAVKVTAANFVSTINPRFVKTEKGYLLTGYGADYQGTTATDHTELTVALENQNVTGLQIPKTLALKGQYSGTPFAVEVAFSGCTATGR